MVCWFSSFFMCSVPSVESRLARQALVHQPFDFAHFTSGRNQIFAHRIKISQRRNCWKLALYHVDTIFISIYFQLRCKIMQRDSWLVSFVRMAFVFIRVQRFVHWETSKATVTSDTGQEWSFVETDSRRNNRSVKLCLNFAAPRNSRATASQPRKRWRWGGGWWDKNGSFFLLFSWWDKNDPWG